MNNRGIRKSNILREIQEIFPVREALGESEVSDIEKENPAFINQKNWNRKGETKL